MSNKENIDSHCNLWNSRHHHHNVRISASTSSTTHEKPPLPRNSRKQKRSRPSFLFSPIKNVVRSPFSKRIKSESLSNRTNWESMGSICIKSATLQQPHASPSQSKSPKRFTSKVSPCMLEENNGGVQNESNLKNKPGKHVCLQTHIKYNISCICLD